MPEHSGLTSSSITLNRFAPLTRLREGVIRYYANTGNRYRAERLSRCGEPIPNGQPGWVYSCHDLACPRCHAEEVSRWRQRAALVDDRLSSSALRSVMLTTTAPDCSTAYELREALADLAADHTRLLMRRPIKRHIVGTARGLEVSESDTGGFHAHTHTLIAFADSIELPALFPAAYISEVRDDLHLATFGGYVGKLPDMSVSGWVASCEAKKGRAFVSLSGGLRQAWAEVADTI